MPRKSSLALLWFWLLVTPAVSAAIYDYTVNYPGGRVLRLNMPDELPFVRGVLIWGNGASGDNRSRAEDPELVAFARSLGFCVLATGYWGNFSDAGGGEFLLFTNALNELARISGHPELPRAPWLPLGHSNGGQMSYGLAVLRPSQVIAFVASKGGYYVDARPSEATLRIPGLLVAGEIDTDQRRTAIRDLFEGNRPRGALWAWVEEEGVGHSEAESAQVIRPFVAEVVRLRLPADADPRAGPVILRDVAEADGWLVEPTSFQRGWADIASYADYRGDRRAAGWLPSQRVAMVFRAFASYRKATSAVSLEGVADNLTDRGAIVTFAVGVPAGEWTAVDFFEGATLLAHETSATADGWRIAVNASQPGYAAFHAVITYADGMRRVTMPKRVFVNQTLAANPTHEPPRLSAVSQPGSLCELRWTLCAGATGYRVENAVAAEGPWREVGCGSCGELRLAALPAGQIHYYRVVALREGEAALSTSSPVSFAVPVVRDAPASLLNLSARAKAGEADSTLIMGFMLVGGSKRVLIRAVGPALADLGVADPLANPALRVLRSDGSLVVANDDWSSGADVTAIEAATESVGGFQLVRGSRDAAVWVELPAAAAQSVAVGGGTGTVLAEVYDAETTSAARLVNLSVRGRVAAGAPLIAGVVVGGAQPVTLLFRAAAPALAAMGVGGTLPAPTLTLCAGDRVLLQNEKWETADNLSELARFTTEVGAFPFAAGGGDAALLATLVPGAYTVVISGREGGAGIALVEIYAGRSPEK